MKRDAALVAGTALAARFAVVLWAWSRFPPAADGVYYHRIAARIAEGHGYTWVWPDGAVTYAAHYPIGYPAIVALGYFVFGAKPAVAMTLNALLGAGACVAVWSLVAKASRPRLALAAGLALALHPALVPYTAAVMTEGPTASLLAIAGALAAHARTHPSGRRRTTWLALAGLTMGVATLVRPQSLALAPVIGWLAVEAGEGLARRAAAAAIVGAIALAACLPWTARNCARMERCALVSVNGGWNLAIGTQTENGGWHEIAVPEACKTVFQEAAKDACFGAEAMKAIARDPTAWLARAPGKLRTTFDYFGAAPWYLHTSNPTSFPLEAKVALGGLETLVSRLFAAAALVAVFRTTRALTPRAIAGVGLVASVLVHGWLAYVALALAALALGKALARLPLLVPLSAATILVTALTHVAFFGSGRYGLVILPFVTALAFVRGCGEPGPGPSLPSSMPYRRSPVALRREESPSSTEHDAG